MKARLDEVTRTASSPEFWNDPRKAAAVLKDQRALQARIADLAKVDRFVGDLDTLLEFEGEEIDADFPKTLDEFRPFLEALEIKALLGRELDINSAIMTIHPGAGGTESQDWAEMLYRMYARWAERHGYTLELMDWQDGDTAGIKSVTFLVRGDYAYGYLKTESGVHRLVRISPFDAAARRHTSFTSVYVSPEINEDIEIEIADKDVRVDIYRSGGAGVRM